MGSFAYTHHSIGRICLNVLTRLIPFSEICVRLTEIDHIINVNRNLSFISGIKAMDCSKRIDFNDALAIPFS